MRRLMGVLISFACTLAVVAYGIVGVKVVGQDKKQENSSTGILTPMILPAGAVQGPGLPGSMPPMAGFYFNGIHSISGVKDAPFSGELIIETIQTLTDGNRIVNRSSTTICRDGQGRTRNEQSFKIPNAFSGESNEHRTIHIMDPIIGSVYMLDPQQHTAQKFMTFTQMNGPGSIENVAIEKVEAAISQSKSSGSARQKSANKVGSPDSPKAAMAVKAGGVHAIATYGVSRATGYESRNESLGKQMIEGVEAEGTRTTDTIPAGAIGNERPIEIVYERWHSQELKMDIMVKSLDPRWGESIQRLTNIDRSEPDPSLFQIPSDYTVQDVGSPVRADFEKKLRGRGQKPNNQ
jgi:hypothetical protein